MQQARERAKEMLAAAKAIQSDVDQILRTKRGPERVPGRGFAGMLPELQRAIASKGGKAAWALGAAHRWTSATAAIAGKKGGSISRRRPKPIED